MKFNKIIFLIFSQLLFNNSFSVEQNLKFVDVDTVLKKQILVKIY